MKPALWFTLSIILAICAVVLTLTGCAAGWDSVLPATQEQVNEQFNDAVLLQQQALEEAAEGDPITAIGLYILSTVSGVLGATGLSKQRRRNQASGASAAAAMMGLASAPPIEVAKTDPAMTNKTDATKAPGQV